MCLHVVPPCPHVGRTASCLNRSRRRVRDGKSRVKRDATARRRGRPRASDRCRRCVRPSRAEVRAKGEATENRCIVASLRKKAFELKAWFRVVAGRTGVGIRISEFDTSARMKSVFAGGAAIDSCSPEASNGPGFDMFDTLQLTRVTYAGVPALRVLRDRQSRRIPRKYRRLPGG